MLCYSAARDWSGLETLMRPKTKISFEEVANDYIVERAHLKPSTIRGYKEILKNYLLPEFGSISIDLINEKLIAKFQARLANSGLTAVRVNNIMGPLRYIMNVCRRRKLIAENPMIGIDPLKEKQPDIDPLTTEELALALSCLHSHYKPLFTCLAWTGARPNELFALRWDDVNFARSEIYIRKGRVRGKEGLPKTNSSKREVPMFSPVREVLLTLKRNSPAHVDGYVFLTKKGQPIDKHMDREWRMALRKAGVRHRPSYQLRHTFASLCLQEAGIKPGEVAAYLGHSNLQTTYKHYARFIKGDSRESVNRIEAFIQTLKLDLPTCYSG